MSSTIDTLFGTDTLIVVSFAGLTAGSGRKSGDISNPSLRQAARIAIQVRSGAVAPTRGSIWEFFLGRSDSVIRSDGAGGGDIAYEPVNIRELGSIVMEGTGSLANRTFTGFFDTWAVTQIALGNNWWIAGRNSTDQTSDPTEGNFYKSFAYYTPQINP